jgi:hypothetical protein
VEAEPGAAELPAEDGLLDGLLLEPEALPEAGGVLGELALPLVLPDLEALDEDLEASLPQAASANAAATATSSALVIRWISSRCA